MTLHTQLDKQLHVSPLSARARFQDCVANLLGDLRVFEVRLGYVTELIGTLMGDTAALDQMTKAAALAGHRDAARRVTQIALEVAGVATGSGLR